MRRPPPTSTLMALALLTGLRAASMKRFWAWANRKQFSLLESMLVTAGGIVVVRLAELLS